MMFGRVRNKLRKRRDHSSPSTSKLLQSNTAGSQSQSLPWEIIERVIDHCSGDTITLAAFSKSCTQLRARSLFVLLRNVKLRSDKQLVDFYDFVQAHPERQPDVKSLTFPWGSISFSLLSILPSLRHLSIEADSFRQFGLPSPLFDVPSAPNIQVLTIRRVGFEDRDAFMHFLSLFPNIQNLTCENITVEANIRSPLDDEDLPCQLRLQTLDVLGDVDNQLREAIFRMAQLLHPPSVPEGIAHAGPSTPPDRLGEDYKVTLTLWAPVWSPLRELQELANELRDFKQVAIADVTLVLWNNDIGHLHQECCGQATLELFSELEAVLLSFPSHRVIFTVPGGQTLHVRKSICWHKLFDFRSLGDNWALGAGVEHFEYSGMHGHDASVSSLVISTDGRWVATSSEDSTIILWDAQTGVISQEWFVNTPAIDVAFSPDGQHLASILKEGAVLVWGIGGATLQLVDALSQRVHIHQGIGGFAWSTNGAYFAFRGSSETISIWDGRVFPSSHLADGIDQLSPFSAKPQFFPDRDWLLARSSEGDDRILDIALGIYHNINGKPGTPSTATAFSRSSTRIAVGYIDGTVCVWDPVIKKDPLWLMRRSHRDKVCTVVLSWDGKLLLSTSESEHMKIWNVDKRKMVTKLVDDLHISVYKACFSPCGEYVATAFSKECKVWRTRNGACLDTFSDSHRISHIAFTPGGILWSAASDGTVQSRRILNKTN